MVKLYVTDIAGLLDPMEHPEVLPNLSKERQLKTKGMRQIKSRKQSLGAGMLLEKVLNLHGLSGNAVWVNSSGKPEIEGLHFNLSHSDDMVICAVSDKPVGCDIEKLREEPSGVAERFFSENEKVYLKEHDEFFRIWTMKESYVKMTGEGTRLPFCDYEIDLGQEVRVIRGGEVQDCFIKEYAIPGYQISVCSEESEFEEQVMWWDFTEYF